MTIVFEMAIEPTVQISSTAAGHLESHKVLPMDWPPGPENSALPTADSQGDCYCSGDVFEAVSYKVLKK